MVIIIFQTLLIASQAFVKVGGKVAAATICLKCRNLS